MGDMGLMGLMGCVLMAAVLTGCLTSWVVILLRKWGVLEWLQVHGSEFVGKLGQEGLVVVENLTSCVFVLF